MSVADRTDKNKYIFHFGAIKLGDGTIVNEISTDSITNLSRIDSSIYNSVILLEDNKQGLFKWDPSNQSANVAIDTLMGIYVPPESDLTGASGAWVRVVENDNNVKWWGAVGDGVTNDTSALQVAINVSGGTSVNRGSLYFPKGTYLHGYLQLKSYLTYHGEGTLLAIAGLTTGPQTSVYYGDNADNLTNNQFPANYPATSFTDVTIKDLRFTTQDSTYYFFSFYNVHNFNVENCNLTYNKPKTALGYALRFVGEYDPTVPGQSAPYGPGPNYYTCPTAVSYSENLKFVGNTLVGAEIELVGCRSVIISENKAFDCPIPYRADFVNRDINISNNTSRVDDPDLKDPVPSDLSGVYVGQMNKNINVISNVLIDHANNGVYIEAAQNVLVEGNTIQNTVVGNICVGVNAISNTVFTETDTLGIRNININGNTFDGVFYALTTGTMDPTNQTTIDTSYSDYQAKALSFTNNICYGTDNILDVGAVFRNISEVICNDNYFEAERAGMFIDSCYQCQLSNNVSKVDNNGYGVFIQGFPATVPHTLYPFLTNISIFNNDVFQISGSSGGRQISLNQVPAFTDPAVDQTYISFVEGKTNVANICQFTGGSSAFNVNGRAPYRQELLNNTASSASLLVSTTLVDTSLGAVTLSLDEGQYAGQVKQISQSGGSLTTTINLIPVSPPSTLMGTNISSIVLGLGESVELVFNGFQWVMLSKATKNSINSTSESLDNTDTVASLEVNTTYVDSSGGVTNLSLAAGHNGQIKRFALLTAGFNLIITPVALSGGTTITLNAVGESATLIYGNGAWQYLGGNGAAIA